MGEGKEIKQITFSRYWYYTKYNTGVPDWDAN